MKREVGEMERSNLMQPGAGHPIGGGDVGIALKVGADHSDHTSVFEITVAPGFDVGAHFHTSIEETFYVLEGSLNLQVGDEIGNGIGPGSFMFVPKGAAHRFWNDTDKPATILFTSSPPGHERYFEELSEILRGSGPPDVDAIRSLRARYDTQQLSALAR
jgi:quercetin dioxygenase-like cupin family protein